MFSSQRALRSEHKQWFWDLKPSILSCPLFCVLFFPSGFLRTLFPGSRLVAACFWLGGFASLGGVCLGLLWSGRYFYVLGYGIRDPRFEISRIETMRTGRSAGSRGPRCTAGAVRGAISSGTQTRGFRAKGAIPYTHPCWAASKASDGWALCHAWSPKVSRPGDFENQGFRCRGFWAARDILACLPCLGHHVCIALVSWGHFKNPRSPKPGFPKPRDQLRCLSPVSTGVARPAGAWALE